VARPEDVTLLAVGSAGSNTRVRPAYITVNTPFTPSADLRGHPHLTVGQVLAAGRDGQHMLRQLGQRQPSDRLQQRRLGERPGGDGGRLRGR